MRTARQEILRVLAVAVEPLAAHEIVVIGYSPNTIASRISDLAAEGLIIGDVRKGKAYKQWRLAPDGALVERQPRKQKSRGRVLNVFASPKAGFDTMVVDVPAGSFQAGQEVRICDR